MGCEKIMNRYLASDRNKDLAREITDHLALCPRCSREVREFESIMTGLARESERMTDRDITAAVLARIAALDVHSEGKISDSKGAAAAEKKVSLRKWMGTGLVMLFGMVLTPFSTILADLTTRIGRDFEVYLHVILGTVISVYAAIFIVSHLDFLRDYFRLQSAGLRK